MHSKRVVLGFLALVAVVFVFTRTRNAPPPDLRDAMSGFEVEYVKSGDANAWLTVNQKVLPQMRTDWRNYFASSAPGEVRNWAGGKLYRGTDQALFTDTLGGAVLLVNNYMNFNEYALNNAAIALCWARQYGFKPVGAPVDFRAGFSPSAFTEKLANPPAGSPKISAWFATTYNSLPPGGSKKSNGLTVVRAGNPHCLLLLDASGDPHQLCEADDLNFALAGDAVLRKLYEDLGGGRIPKLGKGY